MQYATAAGSPTAAERAPSAVQTAQQGLDENTNRLHLILSELEQRLHPVLGLSKPQGVSADKAQLPPASVSARIRESAASVNGAVGRIEDLLNRLEV